MARERSSSAVTRLSATAALTRPWKAVTCCAVTVRFLAFSANAFMAARNSSFSAGVTSGAEAATIWSPIWSNAKKLMGLAFEKIGDQVVAAAAPEVTPAEKERFRAALTAFAERAKAGTAQPAVVQAWQSQVSGALADGRVTGDEMRSLTVWLETSGAAPPPAPAKVP